MRRIPQACCQALRVKGRHVPSRISMRSTTCSCMCACSRQVWNCGTRTVAAHLEDRLRHENRRDVRAQGLTSATTQNIGSIKLHCGVFNDSVCARALYRADGSRRAIRHYLRLGREGLHAVSVSLSVYTVITTQLVSVITFV